jgi:hypothetical protein
VDDWKSDAEVYDAADQAGRKIIELVNSEGEVWLGPPEHYPAGGGAVVLAGIRQDATDILSLDPQKIIDELERMQKVGRAIYQDQSSEIIDAFRSIDYSVQDWQGDGARAFQNQVSKIQAFIGQQCYYTIKAVQSLGALLGIAVQARRDYCALAGATVGACQKALEQNQEADTKFVIGVGATFAGVLLTIASGGSALIATTGMFISTAGAGVQASVEGAKSADVISGYSGTRTQLLENYKSALNTVRDEIIREQNFLSAEKNELFEPLPPSINVNLTNFRYEDFYTPERDPGEFDHKVDQEHQKLITENPRGFVNPNSPIQQRLDG